MSTAADNRFYREPEAKIGHNQPPEDSIAANLNERNKQLLDDGESLLDDAALMPEKLDTEEQSREASDLVKRINEHRKVAEDAHSVEKEPYLRGGQAVDAFFKKPIADLKAAAAGLKDKIGAYLTQQEIERQRKLREEEDKKRKEAEAEAAKALELAAEGKKEAATLAEHKAHNAEVQADKLEKKLDSGASETKVKGDAGTASLRKTWVGEVVDRTQLDLNPLRQFISDESLQKLVTAYVKAGGRELAGAKIYEKTDAVVR